MVRHLLVRSVLFASLVLAFGLGVPSHAGAPGAGMALAAHARPMRNGLLAFVDRGKYNAFYRIAVFNPDGSDLRGLTPPCTRGRCGMSSPTWSPDGTHLAFLGETPASGGNPALLVIGSNGRGEKQLARLVIGSKTLGFPWWWNSRLSWSPDGARIIFAQRDWLAIVNAYTGTLHRVTYCTGPSPSTGSRGRPPTKGCSDSNPIWSPDGSRILISRTLYARRTSVEYIMNANGSGVKPLGPLPAGAGDFAWSPSGHRITFDSANQIYAINPDGSNLTLLVSVCCNGYWGPPSWSPDGTRILYFTTPGHAGAFKAEVWVMSAAGTQRRRLYRSICCIRRWAPPTWSPNGKRILFSVGVWRAPYVNSGIFLMDADGGHRHRLPPLTYGGSAANLAWQPLP